jgi:hypothetical protein
MSTVKFYIKNPKDKDKKLRPAELSIYAVFTKTKKERFSITLDEKIQPKFWDFKNQRVKGTYKRHYELNAYLEQIKFGLLNLYGQYRDKLFSEFRTDKDIIKLWKECKNFDSAIKDQLDVIKELSGKLR